MNIHYFGNLHYDPFNKIRIINNGLDIESYSTFLIDSEGEEKSINRNYIETGEKYGLKLEDLSNFELGENNKLFLSVSTKLLSESGDIIEENQQTIEVDDWESDNTLSNLKFIVNNEILSYKKYFYILIIKDNISNKSISFYVELEGKEINPTKNADLSYTVEYSDIFLKIEENGLYIDEIFLKAADRSINFSSIEPSDFPIIITINKILGLENYSEFPRLDYSIVVFDSNCDLLLSSNSGAVSKVNEEYSALFMLSKKDVKFVSGKDYFISFSILDKDSPAQAAVVLKITAA
jgi:hypothetical protein